jgi:thioredoxin reductase (NADPH)
MAGQRVLVVGGGNSAGQAAMHLARYAKEVIILVRSGSLSESMSEYLVTEIDNAPNIVVRYHAEIVGAGGEGKLERVTVRDQLTGGDETVLAAAVFILIGAEPFTDWLPQGLARDPWGYVLTGLDAKDAWSQERAPFLLETSIPGVFAVGDVRHGSIKRVASAVGEGSIALRFVHEYLVLSGDGS